MTNPADPDLREPGYCIVCGDFHLVMPVPGRPGGVCGSLSCQERLQPYEPGPRHVCNTGYLRRPGHSEYRQCSCGQWLHACEYSYWYKVDRPPRKWLQKHGMDPGEFWDNLSDPSPQESVFGAFSSSMTKWRYIFRYLLHW